MQQRASLAEVKENIKRISFNTVLCQSLYFIPLLIFQSFRLIHFTVSDLCTLVACIVNWLWIGFFRNSRFEDTVDIIINTNILIAILHIIQCLYALSEISVNRMFELVFRLIIIALTTTIVWFVSDIKKRGLYTEANINTYYAAAIDKPYVY